MASMLIDRAPRGATLLHMEVLRAKVAEAILRLNARRAGDASYAPVYVTNVLWHPQQGSCSFVVMFSDHDKRAPKVVKKVLTRERRSLLWSRGLTGIEWFGLGYRPV